MSETMIERVARAIGAVFIAEHGRLVNEALSGSASSMTATADDALMLCARAAIEAMTEGAPIWAEENGCVRGFMDRVDFECELGGASGGNTIFPSEEDCAERCAGHIDQCGMVEVEVRLVRVVRAGQFHDDDNDGSV